MASAPTDVVAAFKKLCEDSGLKGDPIKLNTKVSGKLAKDCFGKIKGVDVLNVVDTNSFSAVTDKTKLLVVNAVNLEKFLVKTAMVIINRADSKRKPTEDDVDVKEVKQELYKRIKDGKLQKHVTKQSATGGVDKMTDASQYTGAHKERFDASGKGKGLDGRADTTKNTGYVGNYRGDGSYGKK